MRRLETGGGLVCAGLSAQLVLLAVLWAGFGLGTAAWLAGTAYGVGLPLLLALALSRSGRRSLGPADRVTFTRALLVGGVAALVVDGAMGAAQVAGAAQAILAVLAGVALAMDGVDGQVARRTGTSSPLGARFDMEVDAVLILVLSVHVAYGLGPWVLAIGAMRYAFVAASWAMPWLCASLPPSLARKTVAALQGVALVAAGAGVLPQAAAAALAAVALAALVWSFGRDVAWLWHARRVPARSESDDGTRVLASVA
ncbi:CDP-alcohol phosphatidyltransferase family protein [Spirillospora sp. NPDC047279]|uniref:CDP-alcohol phosphatidyltransferase family protein n=1 Tax=Spirillospora sp. NPDC047279 TaxID=3155478 RepID=UPI00340D176D